MSQYRITTVNDHTHHIEMKGSALWLRMATAVTARAAQRIVQGLELSDAAIAAATDIIGNLHDPSSPLMQDLSFVNFVQGKTQTWQPTAAQAVELESFINSKVKCGAVRQGIGVRYRTRPARSPGHWVERSYDDGRVWLVVCECPAYDLAVEVMQGMMAKEKDKPKVTHLTAVQGRRLADTVASLTAAIQDAGGSINRIHDKYMDMPLADFLIDVASPNGIRFTHKNEDLD